MACNAVPGRGSGLAGLRQAGPSGDDIIIVAESEGFEPPIPLRVLLISNQVPSAARPALRIFARRSSTALAERVGFEPTIRCRIHAFQACAFGLSATSPKPSAPRAEEVAQEGAAFLAQDAALHCDAVVQPLVPEDIEERARRARLGIGHAVDEAIDAGIDQRARAHRARLERRVD